MCLSDAYEVKNGAETLVCERVTNVEIEGENVRLTNLLGTTKLIPGTLKSVDLNKNIIKIDAQ
ncbi:MAG: CooT family nickel-binding protein [Oscillospiraceae bacterium]